MYVISQELNKKWDEIGYVKSRYNPPSRLTPLSGEETICKTRSNWKLQNGIKMLSTLKVVSHWKQAFQFTVAYYPLRYNPLSQEEKISITHWGYTWDFFWDQKRYCWSLSY